MSRSPIIITGMHASGCDVLGALLSTLSILGPGDHGQQSCYRSDLRIIRRLQNNLIRSESEAADSFHDVWDLLDSTSLHTEAVSGYVYKEATDFLEHLQELSKKEIPLVGWFDSRSSLLLDFWHSLDTKIKVVAVFNEPWTSAHLLRQMHPEQFLANPESALKLWLEYNSSILHFKKNHPDQCLIIHASSLEACFHDLLGWMGVDAAHASRYKDVSIKVKGADNSGYAVWPYPMLYEEVYGEAYLCWKQLLAAADTFPRAEVGKNPQQSLRLTYSNVSNAEVAVIIPTFNQGHLLVDCIASVEEAAAKTSGTVIELLVVDDGTVDPSSKKILSQLSDLGYRILSIPNGGLSNARNIGISSTSAPLIIPVDDDNLLHSGYLIEGVEMMNKNEGIAVVYGDREDFGLRCQTYRPGSVCFEDLLVMNRVDACALIRRTYVESCDGYDTTLPALEDWDLWLKILSLNGKMAYLPKVCFSYCHRSSSMTQRMLDYSGLLENLVSIIRSRY